MEPELDDRDVTSVLSGLFYVNATLSDISDDVCAIRALLEGEDGEEEEDTPENEGGPSPSA